MSVRTRFIFTSVVLLFVIALSSLWFEHQQERIARIDQYKTELSSINETVALFNNINIQFNGFVLNEQNSKDMEKRLLQTEVMLEESQLKDTDVYDDFRILLDDYWSLLENAENIEKEVVGQLIAKHSEKINNIIKTYNQNINEQYKDLWSFNIY